MTVVILGMALGLLIGGLVVMWLSVAAHYSPLVQVVWWIGIILVVFGVVLLATPIMVWLYAQIQAMLGGGSLPRR